jgi:hypothetical protein
LAAEVRQFANESPPTERDVHQHCSLHPVLTAEMRFRASLSECGYVASRAMKTRPLFATVAVLALGLAPLTACAGEIMAPAKTFKQPIEDCPPDSLNTLILRSSYTGRSDFERGDDASGDSWYKQAELHHRIPLALFDWPNIECGQWYLRVGADYRRWDFDNDGGLPIPNTLQSGSAIIGIEYVVRNQTTILIEARPGFFFEHEVDSGNFNVPVLAYAPIWYKQGDDFSWALLAGFSYSGFRSTPLIPAVGLVARYGKWTLLAVPPQPKLMYSVSDRLDLWLEAEAAGGSFRTDSQEFERKPRLNNAVVSYSEWRASAGFTYKYDNVQIELGAGYAFNRKFDFHRAEEGFETDEGAPFAKLEIRTGF